uniref:Ig-like domain-containing protein n=1 Tax=Oncorhynchus tshawytscha TaxID=74940 RepID=A0A8C8GG02_ONCTS
MGQGHPCQPNPPLTQTTLGQLFVDPWVSRSLAAVTYLVSALVSQSQTMEVRTGDTITLQCSNLTMAAGHTAWFKQVNGSEPVCISSMYGFNSTPDLHNGFQRSHFGMFSNNTTNFLKITNVEIGDCGLYFCGLYPHCHMFFVNATYLKIKGTLSTIYLAFDTFENSVMVFVKQNQDPNALNYVSLNFTSKKRKMERRREKELDPRIVCYVLN